MNKAKTSKAQNLQKPNLASTKLVNKYTKAILNAQLLV